MSDPFDLETAVDPLRDHESNAPCYALAEKAMAWQWEPLTAPWIEGRDLSRVPDLECVTLFAKPLMRG